MSLPTPVPVKSVCAVKAQPRRLEKLLATVDETERGACDIAMGLRRCSLHAV